MLATLRKLFPQTNSFFRSSFSADRTWWSENVGSLLVFLASNDLMAPKCFTFLWHSRCYQIDYWLRMKSITSALYTKPLSVKWNLLEGHRCCSYSKLKHSRNLFSVNRWSDMKSSPVAMLPVRKCLFFSRTLDIRKTSCRSYSVPITSCCTILNFFMIN